jgi:hypothetical protein
MALEAYWRVADTEITITDDDDAEPVEWGGTLPGQSLDAALGKLGFERTGPWRAAEKGTVAPVRATGPKGRPRS